MRSASASWNVGIPVAKRYANNTTSTAAPPAAPAANPRTHLTRARSIAVHPG